MAQKSVTIAYILWFFLGVLGVHQVYLRRDRHAFFLWSTLGGVLGIGLLRDLFYIPTYVAAANESEESRAETMSKSEKPSQGLCRWAASVILGFLFSVVVCSALWTDDLHPRYINAIAFLVHTFAAIGVYIPCNEGNQKVALKWCLLGAYLALPYTVWYGPDNLWNVALISSAIAGYKVEWKRERSSHGLCTRVTCLSILGIIYFGLLSTSIYYNATVTTKGETVPLREAVQNFFNSRAWKETKETMEQIYNFYRHHGWRAIWEELLTALDPHGEAHAYEVLGVSSSATQKDIKKAYKSFVLKYHPDKEMDPEKKKEVGEKFMEIQKAYDTLSKLRQSRSQKSEL